MQGLAKPDEDLVEKTVKDTANAIEKVLQNKLAVINPAKLPTHNDKPEYIKSVRRHVCAPPMCRCIKACAALELKSHTSSCTASLVHLRCLCSPQVYSCPARGSVRLRRRAAHH